MRFPHSEVSLGKNILAPWFLLEVSNIVTTCGLFLAKGQALILGLPGRKEVLFSGSWVQLWWGHMDTPPSTHTPFLDGKAVGNTYIQGIKVLQPHT